MDAKKHSQEISLGARIKQKFLESSMSIQEFADKILCHRTTVYDIFKRKSFDTEQLSRISKALDYDFVNEIRDEHNTETQTPQKIFLAVEIDKEMLQKLNLPDTIIQLLKIMN